MNAGNINTLHCVFNFLKENKPTKDGSKLHLIKWGSSGHLPFYSR